MQSIVETVVMFAVIGLWERLAILAICLVLFGWIFLSSIGGGFRRGMREFDKGASEAGRNIGGIYGKLAAEGLTPDNQTGERYDPRNWRGLRRYEKPRPWWLGRLWKQICGFISKLVIKKRE